jgi:hypothetical protein
VRRGRNPSQHAAPDIYSNEIAKYLKKGITTY